MTAILSFEAGIHAIDTGYIRPGLDASHLIIEGGRAAFVDTGVGSSVPLLLAALDQLGIPRANVDLILLTHIHLDHAGGAGLLAASLPAARVIVHPRGLKHMADPSKLVAGSIDVYGEAQFRALYGEIVPIEPSRLVAAGDADYCIAGNLSATSAVLRAAIHVIGLAEGNKTVSSLFYMIAPGGNRVLGFADCGVVPDPSPEQLADITLSTADSFSGVTGVDPVVGMLSFSSRGSAKHPAVEKVRSALAQVRDRRPELVIDGELQFDAAFVPSVALQKVPDSPVAGAANVFVFPSLEAGNIGYKIAERMGGYTALGPMIQGLAKPMHDLSRGCSVEDMVEVTLVANKMAHANSRLSRGKAGNLSQHLLTRVNS